MNDARTWWLERAPGERLFLAGATIVAAIALLVAFAWLPLERNRARLGAELPRLRASIAAMHKQADEVRRLRTLPETAATSARAPLASLASSGVRELAGAQLTLVDATHLQMKAPDVSFGALLEWLASAQATQALRVERARIEALPAPGRVRVELRLERS